MRTGVIPADLPHPLPESRDVLRVMLGTRLPDPAIGFGRSSGNDRHARSIRLRAVKACARTSWNATSRIEP